MGLCIDRPTNNVEMIVSFVVSYSLLFLISILFFLLIKFFDPILKGAVRLNDYKRTSTHEP